MSNLVVLLGPTATGKTKLAVQIADKFNGEIISADSRQIYKGMNIGTGKDLEEYFINNKKIPYHLIDIIDPNINYSVYQFKNDFLKIYKKLLSLNKTPVLCGGTGLYIESILLNYQIPNVPPNNTLRRKMENKDIQYLIKFLRSIDKKLYDERYHITNRRIIRAIEIALAKDQKKLITHSNIFNPLVIGLKIKREQLLNNIKNRLEKRLQTGMIEEVQLLISQGLDLNRLKYFGLEYKFIGQYLFNEIKYDEMILKLNYAINKFSKRQMTFFRRMEKRGINILWIDNNNLSSIEKPLLEYFDNEL